MWTPKRFAGIDAVLRLSCLPVAVSARTVKWSFGNGIRHRAWSRKSQRPAWLVSTGGGFAPANAVLGTTSRSRTPQSAPTIQRGRSIPTRDYIAGAIGPGGAATLLLAPPRDLAVGPLSERSDRPRHAVPRAPAGDGSSGSTAASGRSPRLTAAFRTELTWRRRRRSHERQNSGSFASPRLSLTVAR